MIQAPPSEAHLASFRYVTRKRLLIIFLLLINAWQFVITDMCLTGGRWHSQLVYSYLRIHEHVYLLKDILPASLYYSKSSL